MKPRLTVLILLIILFGLILRENLTQRPDKITRLNSGQVEMCLYCHVKEKPDPAHGAKVIGCAACHLGDAMAFDKEKAHKGIVNNPGDLRIVEQTCGTQGCHAQDVPKVKNSLMATNRGIIATLLYYWGEAETQDGDYSVEDLIKTGKTSLALDYYRKLCGTCHLWKQKDDLEDAPEFFRKKGGGCTACHHIPGKTLPGEDPEKTHPYITKKVPVENCVRCHNRSGRVGLAYQGQYEGESYGTPYEEGRPNSQRLPDGHFYFNLSPDIHHEKNMACIDCHTREEIMGDGKNYAHYEDQLEINCRTCHSETPGITTKNREMNNIEKTGEGYVMISKLDDKKHPLQLPKKGVCDYPLHKRISCEACHSGWVPQCYGCHVKQDKSETHLDKLSLEQTKGWWQEGRSYLRYEKPMLAVWDKEIVIVTPGCQDIVTILDEEGKPEKQFNRLTMAALSPHTTMKKGRTCEECHAFPKTVGLGEGTVWKEDGRWQFEPLHQGVDTPIGRTVPLDGYVDINGNPLQNSSRKDLRPFNGQELARILRVGQCLACHSDYSDPVYKNYHPEKECPVFKE